MTEQNSAEINQTDGSYPHRTVINMSELASAFISNEDDEDQLYKAIESGYPLVLVEPLTAYGWISQGVYHLHIGHVDDPEGKQDGN